MTALLVIVGAVLVVISAVVLMRPLRAAMPGVERTALEAARDRLVLQLDELEVERGDKNVDDAVAQDEQRRLEFELAQVLKRLDGGDAAGTTARVPLSRQGVIVAVVLALALPSAGLGLYLWQNRPTLTALAQAPVAAEPGAGQVPPMVLEMVARLERRLQAQPDDPRGWAQLGRSYAVLGRLQHAQNAYEKAYRLAPNDPEIVAQYGWFLYAQNTLQVSPKAVVLYRKLIALDPTNPDALWVLGLAAYGDGDAPRALRYWERLHKLLPDGNPAKAAVANAIAKVKAATPGERTGRGKG